MDEKIRTQSIDRLNISINTTNILKENKIKTIEQLCKKNKNDLKKLNLIPNEINKIEIELQLLGLNLKNGL